MTRLEFYQLDVFTTTPFTGNQLAVFLNADCLDEHQMQTLAREMNFAESTFLLKPTLPHADASFRIFTPANELPMAGHPTIGTSFLLRHLGLLTNNQATLELKIGPVPIAFEDALIWMTQSDPVFSEPRQDRNAIAQAIGIDPTLLHPTLPIQQVSTGVPYILVPLLNLDALAQAQANQSAISSLPDPRCLYLFTQTEPGFRARMFNPHPNDHAEDPATGSAAGPLGAYATHHHLEPRPQFLIEQGIEMGRPSQIHLRAQDKIQIGGAAVIVGHGEIYW